MSEKYIVIYTDFGDSADELARVLDVYDDKNTAIKDMNSDIEQWCKQNDMNRESDTTMEYEDCVLVGDECRFGCKWQVLEVKIN